QGWTSIVGASSAIVGASSAAAQTVATRPRRPSFHSFSRCLARESCYPGAAMSAGYRITSAVLAAAALLAAAEAGAAPRNRRRRARPVRTVKSATTTRTTPATTVTRARREIHPRFLPLPPVVLPPDASLRDTAVGEACRRALGHANGG